jgi:SH3 domain-containing YSC84-like protein 1
MRAPLTLSLTAAIGLSSFWLSAASKEEERLRESATVVKEILDIPDGIPQELLDKAECIIILPSVKKFALGIGGSYGKGAMTCRSGESFDGPWGPPAMYRLEGGNIGWQIGGQATDFLFLVMNARGVDSLLKSKVKLGVDASAAAGPKGRAAGASTDAAMRAEILTYSRTRGLFAGLSLEGSTLRPDEGANESLYRRTLAARQIVRDGKAAMPAAARELAAVLNRASPQNLSS